MIPTLLIDGRYQTKYANARRLIYVNGRKKWLSQKVFDYLICLVKWRSIDDGRVPGDLIPGDIREKRGGVMYLLRGQSGLPISWSKQAYRLEIEPKNIKMKEVSAYDLMNKI